MHKLYVFLLITIFILFPGAVFAEQPVNSPNVEEQLSALDMHQVEQFVQRLDSEIQSAVPHIDFKEMVVNLFKGELDWQPSDLFNNLLAYLFREVVANLALLGKLIVLAIICAILKNLMDAFDRGTTGKLAYGVSYMVLITLAVGSFGLVVNIGREAVDNMVIFMQALLPLLLTLLTAMGGIASAAIAHPIILAATSVIGTLIKNIIFPLIFFAAILSIVSNLSEKFQISKLADLMKTSGLILMGLFSTVFLGILAVQGVAGAVSDGVAIRTAKFASDAFIPVVGGMFSEALEAVISSSLLLKNAIGIAGLIIIFLLTIFPLLKIISVAFIYKLAAALIQPVGDSQMVDCLNGLGNSLLTVFAAVATVGLLFFFTLAIVVGIGDLTVMLR
ncbi:stage III sporulation protein AE [Desulfolucanica intricata]|uniref:stage III sporulation protein AE n=1 Tax=Desulfolucanica intricata TaxID=1285191 RepID=UPI00083513EE|nr:stage III sporulation protein AE [Desulfolucanica intricata]